MKEILYVASATMFILALVGKWTGAADLDTVAEVVLEAIFVMLAAICGELREANDG